MTPDPRSDSELWDLLDLLRRRKVSIALITLTMLVVTMYYTSRQPQLYRSDAEVLVQAIGPLTFSPYSLALVNLQTEADVASSYPVAEIAAKRLDIPVTPEEVLGGLSVAPRPESEVLALSYTDADPATAQSRAQAFSEAYLEYRRKTAETQAENQTKDAKEQVQDLETKIKDIEARLRRTSNPLQQQSLLTQLSSFSSRQGALQAQIQSITGENTIEAGGGAVVTPASAPRTPISPRPLRNAVLAVLVGLTLGVGLAMARHRLDRRLRGRRDFESLIGAPVLATIPQVEGWKKGTSTELITVSASHSAAAEAYRALRTNVQFLWREQGLQVITVTSAKMGDGKTTTVANLAVSLSQAGRRVIAISCDLRKPRLHRFFGVENDAGVVDLLRGDAELLDIVQRTEVENLRVVASGAIPTNPAELVSSDAMDAFIASLRPMADIIVFDTPPVLAVADALILGPKTDGVILVADASSGARDDVSHVRAELEQVGGHIAGGVFNSFDPERTLYYSPQYRRKYGYGYRAYYEEPGTEAKRAAERASTDGSATEKAAR